jgi:2-polyprenyl-6-methoxyphenol hydroxylase-like FAD-dependent oxidoreductase
VSTAFAAPALQADICVIGAGLIGLVNALQYARRGFTVVIIDELTERGTAAYKVGESALGYTTAFLRTIGGLDTELTESFPKHGVWFIRGLEGKDVFDDTVTEWALQNPLPRRWHAKATDTEFMRTMFQDVHIVRPEVERALRARLTLFHGITLVDNGQVSDIRLDGKEDHVIEWCSKRGGAARGIVAARWLIDCSGRARVLAKRFHHTITLDDGFGTSAVWGQFARCTDENFGDKWKLVLPDGTQAQRDFDTLNIWGDGYWIWLIRLSRDRISAGVSFHRHRIQANINLRDIFWRTLRKHPLLDFLTPENLLDFAAYRDVQHMTDTYVSGQRYAIAGDAASIIDAYYSQGISLACAESWHTANIVERDLRSGILDTDYIAHVNKAALADWEIMRGMVKGKYGPAMADNRFFILDHLLDYLVFGAGLAGRYRLARWLTSTQGRTAVETRKCARMRSVLRRRLFLSQSGALCWVDPARIARALRWCRDGVERRACWRIAHGVRIAPRAAIMRSDAPLPAIWRLFYPGHGKGKARRLSMRPIVEPSFLTPDISAKTPLAFICLGAVLAALCTMALTLDVIDTWMRRVICFLRSAGG